MADYYIYEPGRSTKALQRISSELELPELIWKKPTDAMESGKPRDEVDDMLLLLVGRCRAYLADPASFEE